MVIQSERAGHIEREFVVNSLNNVNHREEAALTSEIDPTCTEFHVVGRENDSEVG